jgi:CubicO group peptidase (beta-lactamase class C family)
MIKSIVNRNLRYSLPTILLLTTVLISCHDHKTNNEMVGVVAERYKPVETVLQEYVVQNKVAGGVGLVYEKRGMVFHKAFGLKDIEEQEQQKLTDIFRIASMTKPITSVAAMMLYDEGKFKLDDPVSKYIPEFKNIQILESINRIDSSFVGRPATQTMTIKQLFTFSSGLHYGYDNDSLSLLFSKTGISEGFEERDILLADNIEKIAALPLLHEPGERYHYGVEMDVLGRLVEIWSGMPLDQFLSHRLFKPLGMKDTYFYLPEDKYNRLVPVYMSSDSGVIPTDYSFVNYPVKGAKRYFSGGADLSSTAYDYFLFCNMILQNGESNGVRFLKPETVKLISSTHLETGDNDMGLGFGLLSAKTTVDLARSVGSITWGGFFTTTFWIDPAEDLIAILMLQMYPFDHWNIQTDFENSIYNAISKEK